MVNQRFSNILRDKRWSGIGGALLLAFLGGCSSLSGNQDQNMNLANSTPQKTGVQLWSDNCGRCHNIRPPDWYSDAQWDVATLHMRVRANISADDVRAIREYLKSAN